MILQGEAGLSVTKIVVTNAGVAVDSNECVLTSGGVGAIDTIKVSIFDDIVECTPLDEPDDFINLTDEYRQRFPHLYQSINLSGELIEISSDEYYELKDFFENSYMYIKYQGGYYYVRLFGIV